MDTNSYNWDEYLDSGRVHINLSNEAWLTIKEDQDNFWFKDKKVTDSGFLNIIIHNFYSRAKASYYERARDKEDELDLLYPEISNPSNDIEVEKTNLHRRELKEEIVEHYIKLYKEESLSYPKGKAFKLKLNKENTEIVKSLPYIKFLGKYLKAIIEEYCHLPAHIREQIFFKDTIDNFDLALSNQRQMKLTLLKRSKANDANTIIERKFYFSPYKIVQDPSKLFNYLIGYAQEIVGVNDLGEKVITSYRLSRIMKAEVSLSKNGFISKEHQKDIDDQIDKLGVQFLIGNVTNIKIRFTPKGLEQFKKQIYLRPSYYEALDKNTYVFYCSEMQAISYFFKFGKNIEVLEPISLRENFIRRYKTALEVYENNNK